MSTDLRLELIPPNLRKGALAALDASNVILFLFGAGFAQALKLVFYNIQPLKERGLYERALVDAWIATAVNHHNWTVDALRFMWEVADPDVLRRLAPLPGPGPFTLYRGVAGRGRAQAINRDGN